MNKIIKVVSTVAAISTTTLVSAPISQRIQHNQLLVRNQTIKTTNIQAMPKHSIYNNTIKIENVWGQSLFNLKFNNNNTLSVIKGWAEVNPYSSSKLTVTIKNVARKVLKTVSFKGGDSPEAEAYNKLNGFNFKIGDTITISSQTGSEYFINDGEKQTGSVTYKIAQNGLIQITAKAQDVSALYDGNNKIQFTCKVKPNILVYLENGGKWSEVASNSKGMVSTVINGNVGDTINIYPVGELETSTSVTLNKADFILQGQEIILNNIWNQQMATIKFKYNNTFKVESGWAQTNPYYTGNDSLTIQLLNNQGKEIYKTIVKGGVNPSSSINKILNGKNFEYGDIFHIESNSGAHIVVGKETYQNNIYLKLNKNGIEYLKSNNNTYKASYDGQNTLVSGKTLANSKITIIANSTEYTTTSNSNGDFSINLPSSVKAGEEISILNSNGVTQTIKVSFNKSDFGILNSELKVTNGWGTDAINIKFNPETMKINTSGYNLFLGDKSGNSFLGFSLYNGNTGDLIQSTVLKGTDNTTALSNALENKSFKFGEIVGINFDSSQGNIAVYNGAKSMGNKTGATEYFKITQNGLVPFENNLKIEPLNVLTNVPMKTLDIKGSTTANTNISISLNGKTFTGVSNSNGEFSINVTSDKIITGQTPINIKANGEIEETVYASPSNMLESNSGVYIAGQWAYYGKIVFNPVTMKMNWFDSNAIINPVDNNPITYRPNVKPANLNTQINSEVGNANVFSIKVTTKTGKVIVSKSFTGNDTLGDVYKAINNVSFEYGDVMSLYHNSNSLGINVISNGKIITPRDSNVSFEITPNGLVDAVKGQSIYNNAFTVGDYYTNAEKGIVSTGLTASGWDAGSESLANSMVMNDAMKERVDQAIKGCTNDYEKAEAIFKIVSPVAYKNVGGNTINTYYNGGVCFNKAQLYAVMCQYAGIVSRVVTGYANNPSPYQRYRGYHSWNQVWVPSQDRWMTVDTTWHIFNCNKYVNDTRHSFSVQATLWDPAHSYTSYFKNDPSKAWEHTGEVWNHSDYYNFNLGNDPQFRNLFKGITPSEIALLNPWGGNAASISFDGENDTFTLGTSSDTEGGNISISLIDPNTGNAIFTNTLKGNEATSVLNNEFVNKHYKIGDVIEINSQNTQTAKKIKVIADGKTLSNGNTIQMYKITNDGLVPFGFSKTITADAKAVTGLNNEGFYSTNVEGTTIPNQEVSIEVNGQIFKTKSNVKGNFKLELRTNQAMTKDTNIYITVWGAKQAIIKPEVKNIAQLEDSSINIDNVWYDNLGTIGFNTNNMKVTNNLGWYETNPYVSSKAELFKISLNNLKGENIAELTAMGSDPVPKKIESLFNGKSFNYGDSITIDYKESANILLNNVWINGKFEKTYKVNGLITLYLTPKGLSNTMTVKN